MPESKKSSRFSLSRSARNWQPRRTQSISPARWTHWVRDFSRRYWRIVVWPQSLSLLFAQKSKNIIQSHVEQWQTVALSICPQIKITLSNLKAPRWIEAATTVSRHDQSVSTNNLEILRERRDARSAVHLNVRNIVDRTVSEVSRSYESNKYHFDSTHFDSTHYFYQQSPVTRVFAPFPVQAGKLSPRLFLDTSLTSQSSWFGERVVDGTRRVEEHTPRVLTLQQRDAKRDIRHTEQTEILSAREFYTRSGERVTLNGRAPLDLEQLTDQIVQKIDSRIVAHRERMGKVF